MNTHIYLYIYIYMYICAVPEREGSARESYGTQRTTYTGCVNCSQGIGPKGMSHNAPACKPLTGPRQTRENESDSEADQSTDCRRAARRR